MKNHKTTTIYSLAISALVMFGCKETPKEDKVQKEVVVNEVAEKVSTISIEKLTGSPAYENASLELVSPETSKALSLNAVDFKFNVENYTLGAQTEGENSERLANSGKGQHIHFILNNQPYSAHYEPEFSKEIPDGTHHLVAFLSRSFHESVKNENSVVVKKIQVGKNIKNDSDFDVNAPTLIYSRPKGTYSSKATENVLLDFFVLNTKLSENGNKVRVTINNETFLISEWTPHIIKGLPMGEAIITLELLDEKGNLIPGKFNKVVRKITLKA